MAEREVRVSPVSRPFVATAVETIVRTAGDVVMRAVQDLSYLLMTSRWLVIAPLFTFVTLIDGNL